MLLATEVLRVLLGHYQRAVTVPRDTPLDGEANPLKNGKTNKNGVLNECGSFSWRSEQPKRLDFNNRPKKAQMYL